MTTSKSEFNGLAALVTGAAGGIGLAIAERLAQGGARIVVCDRDEARLESAARNLAKNTVAVAGDIGTEEGVENLVGRVISQAGPIDVLVNSAGIAEPIVRTIDQKLDDWQRVMDVNLRGTFLVSRAIGRHLLLRKAPGAIVNIASIAGLVG